MKALLLASFFLSSILGFTQETAVLVKPDVEPHPEGKPTDPETGLRVQIFLDQEHFGPGFLDGKPGNFTSRAVYAYNRSKGRNPADWPAVIAEAEAAVPDIYATATVPSIAAKFVDRSLPSSYEAQARRKDLPYRSYLEFMAERYHTSETFLEELNGTKKAWSIGPRDTLIVPNIKPFLIEALTRGKMHKEDPILSARTVVLDTKGRQVFIYDPAEEEVLVKSGPVIVTEDGTDQETYGKLIAVFPITPGQDKFIHHGEWKIANCVEFPEWRYDKQLLKTGKRSKTALQIPPGPNNPVGVVWTGLTKSGIGIHGTSSPRTIGRAQSAGCFRLSNWDAARIPTLVRPGARAIVR